MMGEKWHQNLMQVGGLFQARSLIFIVNIIKYLL